MGVINYRFFDLTLANGSRYVRSRDLGWYRMYGDDTIIKVFDHSLCLFLEDLFFERLESMEKEEVIQKSMRWLGRELANDYRKQQAQINYS